MAMNIDLTILPQYMQVTLRSHHNMVEHVWEGWCADIRGIGKKGLFVESTIRTYTEHNRPYSYKTMDMITAYLLYYFCLPGQSDMQKVGQGFYGWPTD